MKFYTERYFEQKTLEGHPTVKLTCNDSGRWICSQWRDSLGRNGHEHHFVDNFGATFVCKVNKINSTLTIEPGSYVRVNSSGADYEIIFERKLIYDYQLPDHVIDVLQTTILDSSIETLRRVAAAFSKMSDEINRFRY